MPASTSAAPSIASTSTHSATDSLVGVDYIIVIDNGAQNIRIASIPYPFPSEAISAAISRGDSPTVDPSLLAQSIAVDIFPNVIARTRAPHTIPSLSPSETPPTAPPAGTKTSIFVSSHIHSLLDDYAALHLRLPHQSGVVVDWAAQKTIWDHVLTNHLAKLPKQKGLSKKARLLDGKAVIITEAYCNLESAQHATDLLLLEHYGANALWRTNGATLAGLASHVFRSDATLLTSNQESTIRQRESSLAAVDASVEQQLSSSATPPPTAKRPTRPPRTSNSTTSESTIPRIPHAKTTPSHASTRPRLLFLPHHPHHQRHPHHPSIRRLELGGKMLINLLKETLSFQQLDMMDESWLMSYIFAKTSFVAAEVGRRVVGGGEEKMEEVQKKRASEWSVEDLLVMDKFRRKRKGKGMQRKEIGVTWSLPDYGGASGKGGKEMRDKARYGYVLEGPDLQACAAEHKSADDDGPQQRKRPRIDQSDWESSFIASSTAGASHPLPSTTKNDQDQDDQDLQTLTLTTERFSIVEHLFNPTALGLDQMPLPELVHSSIQSVSSSHSKLASDLMWSNILLIGGLSNTVNMRTRLENELHPLAPADVPLRIWPEDRRVDCSTIAIKGGVELACELAARETVRRWEGEEKKDRKKPRKSRVEPNNRGEGALEARWLTYAQYMSAGASGEAEQVVTSANQVFYSGVGKGGSDAA